MATFRVAVNGRWGWPHIDSPGTSRRSYRGRKESRSPAGSIDGYRCLPSTQVRLSGRLLRCRGWRPTSPDNLGLPDLCCKRRPSIPPGPRDGPQSPSSCWQPQRSHPRRPRSPGPTLTMRRTRFLSSRPPTQPSVACNWTPSRSRPPAMLNSWADRPRPTWSFCFGCPPPQMTTAIGPSPWSLGCWANSPRPRTPGGPSPRIVLRLPATSPCGPSACSGSTRSRPRLRCPPSWFWAWDPTVPWGWRS